MEKILKKAYVSLEFYIGEIRGAVHFQSDSDLDKKTNPLFICVMIDPLHLPSRPLKAEKTLCDTVSPLSLRQRLEALTVPHSLGNLQEKVPGLLWTMKSVPWLVAAPNFW